MIPGHGPLPLLPADERRDAGRGPRPAVTRRTWLIAALLLGIAAAGSATAAGLPVDGDVARVEAALAATTTLTARFKEIQPDGKTREGRLAVSRPGRMRMDYEGRRKDFLLSDGTFVYQWDDYLKSFSAVRLSGTPAGLLLRGDVRLSGDVTVTALRRTDDRVEVSLIRTAEPLEGTLTLGLRETDGRLVLDGWRVRDQQGGVTQVLLTDVKTGMPLERSLFVFHEPTPRR